jgi:hypothetical protein
VQIVDPATGARDTVARLPGYTRGLAFYDHYAFIGLSKVRETSTLSMSDMPAVP